MNKYEIKPTNKSISDLEQIEHDIYEFKPHIYAFLAGICFYYRSESSILTLSAVLFAIASGSVFYFRYFSRNYR